MMDGAPAGPDPATWGLAILRSIQSSYEREDGDRQLAMAIPDRLRDYFHVPLPAAGSTGLLWASGPDAAGSSTCRGPAAPIKHTRPASQRCAYGWAIKVHPAFCATDEGDAPAGRSWSRTSVRGCCSARPGRMPQDLLILRASQDAQKRRRPAGRDDAAARGGGAVMYEAAMQDRPQVPPISAARSILFDPHRTRTTAPPARIGCG